MAPDSQSFNIVSFIMVFLTGVGVYAPTPVTVSRSIRKLSNRKSRSISLLRDFSVLRELSQAIPGRTYFCVYSWYRFLNSSLSLRTSRRD